MVNKNYIKGRAKEYRILKRLRKEGFNAIRASGSHGFADIVGIHPDGVIVWIQAKPESMSENAKRSIERRYEWVNNQFSSFFWVE